MVVLATVFGEIPYFLLFHELTKRFKHQTLLIIACLLTSVRFLLLYFIRSSMPLLLACAATGFASTMVIYTITWLLSEELPMSLRGAAQGIVYGTCALSTIVTTSIGGYLTRALGVTNMLLFCAGLGILGGLLYAITKPQDNSIAKISTTEHDSKQ